jgi:hypothetical protein
MFYSQTTVAQKGPLGKIWLAAHWDKKLTNANIFDTSIEVSAQSIVGPVQSSAKKPKLKQEEEGEGMEEEEFQFDEDEDFLAIYNTILNGDEGNVWGGGGKDDELRFLDRGECTSPSTADNSSCVANCLDMLHSPVMGETASLAGAKGEGDAAHPDDLRDARSSRADVDDQLSRAGAAVNEATNKTPVAVLRSILDTMWALDRHAAFPVCEVFPTGRSLYVLADDYGNKIPECEGLGAAILNVYRICHPIRELYEKRNGSWGAPGFDDVEGAAVAVEALRRQLMIAKDAHKVQLGAAETEDKTALSRSWSNFNKDITRQKSRITSNLGLVAARSMAVLYHAGYAPSLFGVRTFNLKNQHSVMDQNALKAMDAIVGAMENQHAKLRK